MGQGSWGGGGAGQGHTPTRGGGVAALFPEALEWSRGSSAGGLPRASGAIIGRRLCVPEHAEPQPVATCHRGPESSPPCSPARLPPASPLPWTPAALAVGGGSPGLGQAQPDLDTLPRPPPQGEASPLPSELLPLLTPPPAPLNPTASPCLVKPSLEPPSSGRAGLPFPWKPCGPRPPWVGRAEAGGRCGPKDSRARPWPGAQLVGAPGPECHPRGPGALYTVGARGAAPVHSGAGRGTSTAHEGECAHGGERGSWPAGSGAPPTPTRALRHGLGSPQTRDRLPVTHTLRATHTQACSSRLGNARPETPGFLLWKLPCRLPLPAPRPPSCCLPTRL